MEIKGTKESQLEAMSGGKENVGGSEVQTSQGEHSSVSLVSPVSSPVSPVSLSGDQVQDAQYSPSPGKEGGYLHYSIMLLLGNGWTLRFCRVVFIACIAGFV